MAKPNHGLSLLPYATLLPYIAGMSIAHSASALVNFESVEALTPDIASTLVVAGVGIVMLCVFLRAFSKNNWRRRSVRSVTYGAIVLMAVSSLLLEKGILAGFSFTPLHRLVLFFLCLTASCWCTLYWIRQMAYISRLAAALFAFGSIIVGETLAFILTFLPEGIRYYSFAVLALLQFALILFIRNRDAISDTLPYESDGFFHFVKDNISKRSFLATIALGIYCAAIPLGMSQAYYENYNVVFTLPAYITCLLLIIVLSSAWLVLAAKSREAAYTTIFWIIVQLLMALAVLCYVAFPDRIVYGAFLSRTTASFVWGFIWFTTIAFMSYGWRNPFYYATAGWFAVTVPQTLGYLSASTALRLTDSHSLILAIISLLVLVSSQVFFVRLFKTSETDNAEHPAYKQEKIPLQNLMGLNNEADLPAECKRSQIEVKATAVGEMFMLTQREQEIFSLFALGYTQKKVAEELFLSTDTVHTYIKRIYKKTDFHSRNDILDFMREQM